MRWCAQRLRWPPGRPDGHDAEAIDQPPKPRRRRALLVVALLLVLVLGPDWALRSGAAFDLLGPPLLDLAAERCGIEVSVGRLELRLIGAAATVRDLEVRTSTGARLLSLRRAHLELSTLGLLGGRFVVKEAFLDRPRAILRLGDEGWLDRPRCSVSSPPPGSDALAPPLRIVSVTLRGGGLEVIRDGTRVDLDGLELALDRTPSGSRIELSARTASVASPRIDPPLPLSGPQLQGWVDGPLTGPTGFRLERLWLEAPGTTVEVRGLVDERLRYTLQVGARARLDALAPYLSAPISGQLDLSAEVRGAGLELAYEGIVDATRVRIDRRDLGRRTRIELAGDRSGLDLTQVRVDLGPGRGTALASGRLDFDAKLSLRAEATARRVSFARLMDAIGTDGVWTDFAGTGTSRVSGTLRPVRLEGPFDFSLGGVDVWDGPWTRSRSQARMLDVVPARVRGRWTFTRDALDITSARIETERSRGEASALIHHQSPRYLDIEAHFDPINFVDLGPVGGARLAGIGRLDAELGGPFEALGARGTVDLEAVSVGQVPLGAAEAEVRWDGERTLALDAVRGRIGSAVWRGKVGLRFEGDVPVALRGEVIRGRLGDLMLPLGLPSSGVDGEVRGRFDLEGSVTRWTGPVNLEVTDLSVIGQRFDRGRASGRLDRGRVVVEEAMMLRETESRTATVSGAGWLDFARRELDVQAAVRGMPAGALDPLAAILPRLSGDVDGALKLKGSFRKPEGRARLQLSGAAADGRPLGPIDTRIRFIDGRAEVRASAPEVAADLDARVQLVPGLTYTSTLRLSRSDLPTRLGDLLGLPLSGDTTARVRLRGRLTQPGRSDGAVELDALRLASVGVEVRLDGPRRFGLQDGQLELTSLSLSGEHLQLNAQGEVGPRAVELDVDGRLQLGVLSRWLESLERASGRLGFVGHLRRGRSGLEFVGRGDVGGGALEIRGIQNRLSGIEGPLTFSQSSVIVDGMVGRWAGGQLGVNGSIRLEDLRPERFAIRGRIERARPRIGLALADLTGRVDGAVDRKSVV